VPRKKARERWKPKRNTETTAVRSIATEVEYTCVNGKVNYKLEFHFKGLCLRK